jgi:hypothetical protein
MLEKEMGCSGLSYIDRGEAPRADVYTVSSKQRRTHCVDWLLLVIDADQNLPASKA